MAAAVPRIGYVGDRLDLDVRQGGTFGPYEISELDDDDLPIDLTGCTIRGQIRKSLSSAAVLASFTCAIVDAAGGIWNFGLTNLQTQALDAGPSSSHPDSRYVYDIELVDVAGRVHPRLYGTIFVTGEVTRT